MRGIAHQRAAIGRRSASALRRRSGKGRALTGQREAAQHAGAGRGERRIELRWRKASSSLRARSASAGPDDANARRRPAAAAPAVRWTGTAARRCAGDRARRAPWRRWPAGRSRGRALQCPAASRTAEAGAVGAHHQFRVERARFQLQRCRVRPEVMPRSQRHAAGLRRPCRHSAAAARPAARGSRRCCPGPARPASAASKRSTSGLSGGVDSCHTTMRS